MISFKSFIENFDFHHQPAQPDSRKSNAIASKQYFNTISSGSHFEKFILEDVKSRILAFLVFLVEDVLYNINEPHRFGKIKTEILNCRPVNLTTDNPYLSFLVERLNAVTNILKNEYQFHKDKDRLHVFLHLLLEPAADASTENEGDDAYLEKWNEYDKKLAQIVFSKLNKKSSPLETDLERLIKSREPNVGLVLDILFDMGYDMDQFLNWFNKFGYDFKSINEIVNFLNQNRTERFAFYQTLDVLFKNNS